MAADASLSDGDPLNAFLAQARRSLLDQRRATDDALNEWAAAAPADCELALDTASLKAPGEDRAAQNRLYHHGWRVAYMTATNVGDHLCAIADTAGADAPRAFAHMTLARAALEGAARINYLLTPAGTVRDRVLRAGAVMLASAEEELRAVAEFAGRNDGLHRVADEVARHRLREVSDLIRAAGIEVVTDKSGGRSVGLRWVGSNRAISTSINITAILNTLAPSRPGAYRVGSGAAHSQPWVLDDDEAFDIRTNRFNWTFDPVALAGSVDLAILAAALTLEAFASLLGADASEERIRAQEREQATTRLVLTFVGK